MNDYRKAIRLVKNYTGPLEIACDNAAFVDEGLNLELAGILSGLAHKLEQRAELSEGEEGVLFDYNGNNVGGWRVEE